MSAKPARATSLGLLLRKTILAEDAFPIEEAATPGPR